MVDPFRRFYSEITLSLNRLMKRKTVSFKNTVEVYDCIQLTGMTEHNMKDNMWWNVTDYSAFNIDAEVDIKRIMEKFKYIDRDSARKLMCNTGHDF
jgi:hypothetical protein